MSKSKHEHYALIMAGGQGKRFWPYSTQKTPKQFLNIVGSETLITQTFNRLSKFIKKDNIFIVADKMYLSQVESCIPEFKSGNFISEPMPKNTAPCLMLANIVLSLKNKDANLVVVPADHFIPDEDVFAEQILAALDFADRKYIMTSGIKPDSPHTGYGYINFEEGTPVMSGKVNFYQVNSFKEKPELQTAEKYFKSGNYYWNSGIFIYKLSHFKEFLKQYSAYYYEKYLELENTIGSDQFFKQFESIKPESIDYALMEKVKEVKMFKADYLWSDVGAWSSVYELGDKDSEGNVAKADKSIFIDSNNSLIFSNEEQKPVSIIGLKDVVVVNTKDGILVSHIDQLQKVKEVLDKI